MAEKVWLSDYKIKGKKLIPHLMNVPNIRFDSWGNNRMPEMLWAALIRVHIDRQDALKVYREIGDCFFENKDRDDVSPDITLSGIAKLPLDLQQQVFSIICTETTSPFLGSMLVFNNLPGKKAWMSKVPQLQEESAWSLLANTVSHCFFHNSIESTDCRVAKIIPLIAMGKLHFVGETIGEEIINDLLYYPHGVDPKRAESTIRALEGGISGMFSSEDLINHEWAEHFWKECFERTMCLSFITQKDGISKRSKTKKIKILRKKLLSHFEATISTTGIDPKHEATFGIGLFGLQLIEELIDCGIQNAATGRILLRTLAEAYITLRWLVIRDENELWEAFRKYGCGQAKLQAIKIEELEEKVSFADVKMLDEIANEDQWDRFLEIGLGQWSGTNLRQMSDEASVKSIYDIFYNWGSSYTHAGWGAIRESNFQNCANPLHRFHQIPLKKPLKLPTVLPDACMLVNLILETISGQYSVFEHRIVL